MNGLSIMSDGFLGMVGGGGPVNIYDSVTAIVEIENEDMEATVVIEDSISVTVELE